MEQFAAIFCGMRRAEHFKEQNKQIFEANRTSVTVDFSLRAVYIRTVYIFSELYIYIYIYTFIYS